MSEAQIPKDVIKIEGNEGQDEERKPNDEKDARNSLHQPPLAQEEKVNQEKKEVAATLQEFLRKKAKSAHDSSKHNKPLVSQDLPSTNSQPPINTYAPELTLLDELDLSAMQA